MRSSPGAPNVEGFNALRSGPTIAHQSDVPLSQHVCPSGRGFSATQRVLIVDDEAPMRGLMRSWVEREGGLSVIEAGTAEEGVERVALEAPAIVLCDIRLPGEDGLWLAAQVRIHHPRTAVVMTTGVLEFSAAVSSLQSGVVDYLVKPFSRERLSEALSRAWYAHMSRSALDELQRELDDRRTQLAAALDDCVAK